jgi:hypothetical protein
VRACIYVLSGNTHPCHADQKGDQAPRNDSFANPAAAATQVAAHEGDHVHIVEHLHGSHSTEPTESFINFDMHAD